MKDQITIVSQNDDTFETETHKNAEIDRQKEEVLKRLRERGMRITKQRKLLLDIILEENCSCCKEIYYKASQLDSGIGTATIYRMINTLEDIGVIHRSNMFKIEVA